MNELDSTLDALVAGAPAGAADWDDVVKRARRPRRLALAGLAATVGLATIVVATPAFGIGERIRGLVEGTPVGSEQLSERELHVLGAMAHGVSPRDAASKEEDRARFGAASFRQLAARNGRVFFAAERKGGGLCVATGTVGDPDLYGSILCTPDFPSPSQPILDRSDFRGPITRPSVSRLEGVAADGVASVGVVTEGGDLEALTSVEDNVYVRTGELPTEPVREIVALDANGDRIYSMCFVREGCEK